MKRNFDLIIFDWDGTLSNSTNLITDLILKACSLEQIDLPSLKKVKSIIGLDLEQALHKLLPDCGSSEIKSLQNTYINLYKAESHNINLFEGVELGVKELFRKGYILTIATGGSRRGLNRALNGSIIKPYFKITKTVDDCFSKPHPQMITDTLNELMVEPGRVLMVGDSVFDLQMAMNAKVASLAVTYGSQPLSQLNGFNSLGFVTDAYEMFEWLRKNG
jgi:phosphoglycolate phosphatase